MINGELREKKDISKKEVTDKRERVRNKREERRESKNKREMR